MFPELKFTPDRIDSLARFVADFSLAGMRDLVQNGTAYDGARALAPPGKSTVEGWEVFLKPLEFEGISSVYAGRRPIFA